MFYTNKEELTFEDIKKFITEHSKNISRFERLQKQYGNEDVDDDVISALDVGENLQSKKKEIKNPYASYITDMSTAFFMGKPVVYKSKNIKLLEEIQKIFKYSDEQDENYELAKSSSIHGVSYELLYIDESARIRFREISPQELFVIKKISLDDVFMAAVRKYVVDEVFYLEWYGKDTVKYYSGKSVEDLKFVGEKELVFGDVPVVEFINNKELKGDFEKLTTQIQAYNTVQSNTLQDMEDFTDAYLALAGMFGTDEKDVEKFKKDKLLLLESTGDAKWLVKDVNDTWIENFKTRLRQDIHKFSFTPDFSDENFAGNSSGVSLEYKLLGMQQLRGIKERKFKKGLQRRLELICNALKIKTGEDFDLFTDIDIVFNDTLPQNLLELSQVIGNLSPFLSKETLIALLSFVESVKDELERKKKEEKELISDEYEDKREVLERQE